MFLLCGFLAMGRLSAAGVSVISLCDEKQLHHKKMLQLKHHPKQTRGTCSLQQGALAPPSFLNESYGCYEKKDKHL